jgi:hypothetical protein
MRRAVRFNFDTGAVVAFVARQLDFDGDFGHCVALGFDGPEGLEAGFVYHDYQPDFGTIEITGATKGFTGTRGKLKAVFDYPFGQLGCQMCIARTINPRVVRIWTALGAQKYVIPRLFGRHTDGSILTLTSEAWGQWNEKS